MIISHRSGETEDHFIADLAVATNAGQIKTGHYRGQTGWQNITSCYALKKSWIAVASMPAGLSSEGKNPIYPAIRFSLDHANPL